MSPLAILGWIVGGATATGAVGYAARSMPRVIASSRLGDEKEERPAPSTIPQVSSLLITLWEQPSQVPGDKLSTRGQKFIDPYNFCDHEPRDGYPNDLARLPATGVARMTAMHAKVQSTTPRAMPAYDILLAVAGGFGAQALDAVGVDIARRQKWWADRIRTYTKWTANGWAIAVGELLGWLIERMPASWAPEYARAQSIAADTAASLQLDLVNGIGFNLPYPLHALDGTISSLGDLHLRATVVNYNIKKMLALPDKAKEMIAAWNTLFVSQLSDTDVQRAAIAVDNHMLGVLYRASDEQVYLTAVVFAKSIGADPLKFAIELWDRAKGWSRFPSLLSNSAFVYAKMANGDLAIGAAPTHPSYAWNQDAGVGRSLGKWDPNTEPDPDTGMVWAGPCVTNARQVQQLDLVLTGFQMVYEKTGQGNPIDTKLIRITPL